MDINAIKKMKAETEIKKCYDMGKITKRQHDLLMKHMEHHTFAHIRKMLDLMSGKTFRKTFPAAHKEAMKTVGR